MANYCAYARSNVFRVKDLDAFTEVVTTLSPNTIIERRCIDRVEPYVMLYATDDSGAWDSWVDDADGNTHLIDWPATIADHLYPGETCILMEIGNEKLRYLVGWAIAIHSDGRTASISLEEIYPRAAKEFGTYEHTFTRCEY